MGLAIKLQDEWGEVIEVVYDPKDLLGPYIEESWDQSYEYVRFIDRYGDTYFNQLQLETFLAEWGRLQDSVKEKTAEMEKEVRSMFMRVKALAQQAQKEPHLYIKFVGD